MDPKNKLSPLQAFSYLTTQKNQTHFRQEWINLILLFLGMVSLLFLPFPAHIVKQWVSHSLFYGIECIFLLVKAFLFSEFLFYFLHRYFEHLGWASRLSPFIQQNQQYHWIHHMIIYPLNKQYKKGTHYVSMTRGFTSTAWRACIGGMVIGLSMFAMGMTWQTLLCNLFILGYGKSIAHIHNRFHYSSSWDKNRYFQWLSDIHILHHFDQKKNFTIVSPLLDILFGSYASPKQAMTPFRQYLRKNDLNPSDFINFSYLMDEATPDEVAIFISGLQKFPGERHKVASMINTLDEIHVEEPYAKEAKVMKEKLQHYVTIANAEHGLNI